MAAIIFFVASLVGVPTVGFHMTCFSAFMVFYSEAYEWIVLNSIKGVPFLLAFSAIVVSVSVVSVVGRYLGEYTDIICAVTIFGNMASLCFRIR